MAIEFGTGLNGAATSTLAARVPSVRRADSRSRDQEPDRAQLNRDATEQRVGFGEGTISVLGVAATTVDRNLESAREIVPTLDELSAEARARAEAVRDDAANTEQARAENSSPESRRNESAARAQAQGFVQPPPAAETDQVARDEPAEVQRATFSTSARTVESVVSVVAPDPASTFDVFG